ncbi:hypothetical protein TW95_gp1556 [Pandoravirus inopinatum]|uniref:DUF5900 domain-containing protein n=1 Tax=Pandoravirus inopinatum TaxID=1605721 RepID=A0A0B5J8N1_9VIRU|nr:hypothetical protein TW95_gp1556 [Pandoravirus inopinatum]AJF98290.1 hypothetical protein [Pandoravirus inopinatum]
MDPILLAPLLVLVAIVCFFTVVSRRRSLGPPRPPLPPPLSKIRPRVGDRPMPRGALTLVPSLQTPDQDWWRRDKATVMADAGGADRFWAACKMPVDASSPTCMALDGYQVRIGCVVDDDGTIRYGQFDADVDIGDKLHGYGVRRQPDGTVTEGFWNSDLLWGPARTLYPNGRVEAGHYVGEGEPFGRFWWADPDGRHGYVDRWPSVTWYEQECDYGQVSIESASGMCVRADIDADCPVGTEVESFDRERADWPNGDYAVTEWTGCLMGKVISYGMANGAERVTIDAQHWTVERHRPSVECAYDGYVYAPSDVDSPAFALWAHYILSGRSARPGGYAPERQAAFIALLHRTLEGREPPAIACPFVNEPGPTDAAMATFCLAPFAPGDVNEDEASGDRDAINLPGILVDARDKAWTRIQDEAIRRCGGPLAFALACEIDLDRSTVQHWSEDGVKVAVGCRRLDDGTILRGEFDTETHNLHGYGVAVHPDASVRQGEWVDGKLDGMAITRDSNGYMGIGVYLDDLPNGRLFYEGHGVKIAIDRWLPYKEVADGMAIGYESDRSPCGETVTAQVDSDGSTDHSWFDRRWSNGDHANERWYAGSLVGVSFVISPASWPDSLLSGARVEGIDWRIRKHEPTPTCPFDGYTYVPADTASPEFALFSAYILSGRSAHNGFCAARQRAFAAAIADALSQPS